MMDFSAAANEEGRREKAMQLLAMLTMLADHVGKIFFPREIGWQLIGRLAFPIYCYCLVLGYRKTKNMNNYMIRLFLIGLLSQIPYMLALNIKGINVIGTLLVSLSVIYALDSIKGIIAQILIVLAALAVLDTLPFDYGAYGLLLVLVYRYMQGIKMVGAHYVVNVLFIIYKGWIIQMFSLIATLGIAYAPMIFRRLEEIRIPRWLWRSFYPAHFIILFGVAVWVGSR